MTGKASVCFKHTILSHLCTPGLLLRKVSGIVKLWILESYKKLSYTAFPNLLSDRGFQALLVAVPTENPALKTIKSMCRWGRVALDSGETMKYDPESPVLVTDP